MNQLSQSICNINNSNCILLGDFNFPHINWVNKTADAALSQDFLDVVEENMLFQLIHKPTRGIIFWIWFLLGTLILGPFSSSDHSKTLVELRIPAPRVDHAPRKVYSYSKGKYDQFNLAVSQIKWYDLLCDKTVDQQWMTFKELYEEFIEKYISVKFV